MIKLIQKISQKFGYNLVKINKISLLHLDTDWYESTYHELKHLFPLLSKNGVLIVDDYGFWQGSRDAVDQYFKEYSIKLLFNRIDYNGRLFIKTY